MTRKVSLKIKFNLFLVFLLLGASFILTTVFIDIHKKSFLSLLENEFQYQINELSTYLDFQDELRKERRKKINFDEDVYESFKKHTHTKKIDGNGQIIVFNKKGDLLIHSTDEGKNVSQEFYVNKILSSNIKENTFHFKDLKDFTNKYAIYKYHETYGIYLCLLVDWKVATAPVTKMRTVILVSFLIASLLIIIFFNLFFKSFHTSVISIYRTMKSFVNADYSNKIKLGNTKEFYEISTELDSFKNYLLQNINFAQNISNGKLDLSFQPINKNDLLGLSLIKVRDNMGSAKEEQERRKIEDEKQNWLNKGLANFSDLLRLHNSDLKKHSDIIVQNLVSYIGANQGAIFIANKDDVNATYLEMISAFAYNTLKYIQKNIPLGEGLVGTCAIEKRTIFLKEIPENYIEITSGLGYANPRCILIVPIKMEEEILGVVEIASFKVFEKHEIYFVEKIMESFASTLSSAKINAQTANLLKRFELQNEQMKNQEEEMRQNMEELNAIQEDAEALKIELTREIDLIANTILICEYFRMAR
ncbi:MAG: GAF domain-containing protein [Bacteroidales bacterium]|nr:GAF domain-containing protein [Bacteroidales bacterium]